MLFKEFFSQAAVTGLAGRLASAWPPFPSGEFLARYRAGHGPLELKARWGLCTDLLMELLPATFTDGRPVVEAVVAAWPDGNGLEASAFLLAPLEDWVAQRGCNDDSFDEALSLLGRMTTRFSAEFAVRPFLAADLPRALVHVRRWAADPDPRVRRLASEGTRPRLPWGPRLAALVQDPAPLVPVLESLRDDPDAVVRRSVANHLNDITKDHPNLVAALCADWWPAGGAPRRALLRHAVRSLVKAGHPGVLACLGYGLPAGVRVGAPVIEPASVPAGGAVRFTWTVENTSGAACPLLLDYRVSFAGSRGAGRSKVFKGGTCTVGPGQRIVFERGYSFRPITTRRYYPGTHGVVLLVNGLAHGAGEFVLLADG